MPVLLLVMYAVLLGISIGMLACFITVVVAMFKHEQTGLAIATIVLAICGGFGGLLAFIMGWINVGQWQLKKVMTAWTCLVFAEAVCVAITVAIGFSYAAKEIRSLDIQMQENGGADLPDGLEIQMPDGLDIQMPDDLKIEPPAN